MRAFATAALAVFLSGMMTLPETHAAESATPAAETLAAARSAIESGDFAAAERLLRPLVTDPDAPVTTEPARLLEIMRRIKIDYSLDADAMLERLQVTMPDATAADVARWQQSGALQHRVIDGEVRFFNRATTNLYLFTPAAKARRESAPKPAGDDFTMAGLAEQLTRASRNTDTAQYFPVQHEITYSVWIPAGHARLKPGATVRAWLPFPQVYRQQQDVAVVSTSPAAAKIAPNGHPQRTIHFEHTVASEEESPRFSVTLRYRNHAYRPHVKLEEVQPYDTDSDLYRTYTAERLPHIPFTPEVRQLSQEIVGDETNPLAKARLIFRWVSTNIPWCAEMEYSTIFSLPLKGIEAGRGDCGVQALVFITLCRAAGVPARWQSGFQTHPNNWNLHDWSEFYVEPYGWLPADASFGVQQSDDPEAAMFYCGGLDPYRWIVNLDYARELDPPKTSFRSEPNDFQRGEVEIDGHNLYFGEWRWKLDLKTWPVGQGIAGLNLALDSIVFDLLDDGDIPGAVIAVGQKTDDGFETWQKAYGFKQFEPEKQPMPENAIFDLASLTKPLATGTSILQLVEAGQVALDAPVARYLPEFDTPEKRAIEVRHLLTHTSGLPPYLSMAQREQLTSEHGFPCPAPTRALIRAIEPTHPPGEKVVYSCLNAIVAAEVVEAASGQDLAAYTKEHIFYPLRMLDTMFKPYATARCVPTTRTDHGKGADGFLLGQVHDPIAALQDGVSGNAGLFGTAADLQRFAQMLLNGGELDGIRVLKEETVAALPRVVFPDATNKSGAAKDWRGLMWDLYPADKSDQAAQQPLVFGHTGYTGTYLRIDPQQQRYVIILANRVHPDDSGKVAELRREVWEMVGHVLADDPATKKPVSAR